MKLRELMLAVLLLAPLAGAGVAQQSFVCGHAGGCVATLITASGQVVERTFAPGGQIHAPEGTTVLLTSDGWAPLPPRKD